MLPNKYASPEVLVNYNYVDVAEGTGIITFYGIASEDAAVIDYHLIGTAGVYSSQVTTKRAPGAGTTTIDFDLAPFNSPRYPKGTAYFNAGMAVYNSESVHLDVQIKHWDGTTETNLSAEIASQTLTVGGGANDSEMVFLKIPITTEKLFAIGDMLRLTVKLTSGIGSGTVEVGHDPANRNGQYLVPTTKNTTIMQLQMPFRMDV